MGVGQLEEEGAPALRGFPPYQRRRLQSGTYGDIIRIFSLFNQQPRQVNPLETTVNAGQDTQEEKEVDCLSKNNVLPEIELKHVVEVEGPTRNPCTLEESVDIEEGEVSDDIGEINLTDKCFVDDSLREHGHNVGENGGSWRTYEKFMLSILSPAGRGTSGEGLNEVKKTKEVSYSDIFSGQIIPENEEKKASTGVEARVKRKRSTTKERSEKKKAKRRKKRAEQDRQSGVKRLKLQPISKPKVVNHCKFYINGKCQQGDACKFSHDTTPLTKAKPCNFLALNKCLKGDDCPYDHELSKYPCNIYKSQGFCPRGDSCLFSHKVSLMNDSSPASDVNKVAQEISSMQVSANSGKQSHTGNTSQQSLDRSKSTTPRTLPSFKTITRQPTKQDVTEVKPPARAPKGISFLSFGKAQSDGTGKQQQNELPTTRENGAGAAEKLQYPNEISGRKPASTLSLFPSSTLIEASDKALSLTSLRTSNCDSKVTTPCLQPFAPGGNIPTVSNILQEFLFNGH